MENPLRARMAERFAAVGASPIDVAISLGMGRDYIRDFLKGRKRSLNFELLPAIAAELGCDPRYLTGEIPTPDGSDLPPQAQAPEVLRISGIVEDGVRRKAGAGLPDRPLVPADSRYRAVDQSAYLVRGNLWKTWGIQDSSVIVAVSGLPARDGDLLVLERFSEDGMMETTIGMMEAGRITLADDSSLDAEGMEPRGVVAMEMKIFG